MLQIHSIYFIIVVNIIKSGFNYRILSIILVTSFLFGVLFFSINYIQNETENEGK